MRCAEVTTVVTCEEGWGCRLPTAGPHSVRFDGADAEAISAELARLGWTTTGARDVCRWCQRPAKAAEQKEAGR